MKKIMFTYGGIAGAIVIGTMVIGFILSDGTGLGSSQLVGYSVMLVALSLIFLGIKRYRDQDLGGVIKFSTAFVLGLGISAVAGVVYVIVWEIYLASIGGAFVDNYTAGVIETKEAAGMAGAELEKLKASMESMKENYANPLFRLPLTFMEIFPVGLIVSLVSALVLRNSNILPAKV